MTLSWAKKNQAVGVDLSAVTLSCRISHGDRSGQTLRITFMVLAFHNPKISTLIYTNKHSRDS
jgi:hypothetical protein